MDSHEERVFLQIKHAQEKAAKETMEARAKEFKRQQKEALSKGLKPNLGTSFSSATGISSSSTPLNTAVSSLPAPAAPPSRAGGGKALKLGAKTKDEDSFVKQLRQEGQVVGSLEKGKGGAANRAQAAAETAAASRKEPVHIRTEERLQAVVSRDGGLQSAELFGTMILSVATAEFNTVAIEMHNNAGADGTPVQIQVHPNMDKSEWSSSSVLKLKSTQKPFPVSADVGVLKWRAQLPDEGALPLVLNVWPEEAADGCTVNIEYTLQKTNMVLEDVVVTVPLPPVTTPVVSECEGSYEFQKARSQLVWSLPVIDSSNPSGTLEFVTPDGSADQFFPVQLKFSSQQLLVDIAVKGVKQLSGEAVSNSALTLFNVEKYDIV